MYHLVNQFAVAIVDTIPRDDLLEYKWLLKNISQANTLDYQKRYKNYWQMNVAQLGSDFYRAYFNALTSLPPQQRMLCDLIQVLYDASARRDGRKSIQFSFATKLLHMTNPGLPLYSSEITKFFFFRERESELSRRIAELASFHDFLIQEYARVVENGLLLSAIQEFRHRFNTWHFTDEKIIDSLICAFVRLLENGALLKGKLVYR
jgi:hypothetical protein